MLLAGPRGEPVVHDSVPRLPHSGLDPAWPFSAWIDLEAKLPSQTRFSDSWQFELNIASGGTNPRKGLSVHQGVRVVSLTSRALRGWPPGGKRDPNSESWCPRWRCIQLSERLTDDSIANFLFKYCATPIFTFSSTSEDRDRVQGRFLEGTSTERMLR